MPLPTIVDAYVEAAFKRASFERVDGVFAATVPEAFGVIAFGASEQDCSEDLRARLEEWVVGSLSEGEALPVLDGIDFDSPETRSLIPYHPPVPSARDSAFFSDEKEFFTALSQWERED